MVHLKEPSKSEKLASVSIRVEQGENRPPEVVVSSKGRQLTLTAPDPALSNITYAPSRRFSWMGARGEEQVGGLIAPVGAAACVEQVLNGQRLADSSCSNLPLVIQTYDYDPENFRPDGPRSNAFAAQSLASLGMIVLNMNLPVKLGSEQELSDFVVNVDSAVARLSSAGVVNSNKVGLVGFSRSGLDTYYLATHPGKVKPAAVVIDSAFKGTFGDYLRGAGGGFVDRSQWDVLYGGPFWTFKENWLRRENVFNTMSLNAPALFADRGTGVGPGMREVYGALSLARRPFKYVVYPFGSHSLSLPEQIYKSKSYTTDWMAFWLLGYEDPSTEKVAQYLDWRNIRESWKQQKAWESLGNPMGTRPMPGDLSVESN